MITAVNTSPFHLSALRKTNTWFSVCDGNWNNANTWTSNGLDKKRHISPQPGDNVYINHVVTCDVSASVKNIWVSGTLKFANNLAIVLIVTGELQASGTIDQTTNGTSAIVLNGTNTIITNYIPGTSSTVQYASPFTKFIPSLPYNNLYLTGNSTSYITAPLTISGILSVWGTLDTQNNMVTVNGQTTQGANLPQPETVRSGIIISSGNLLLIGAVVTGGGRGLAITGTASIECRGGMTSNNGNIDATNSNINFTTNNQTIYNGNSSVICNNITITGAITVNTDPTSNRPLIINGTLNGTQSNSTFNNDGQVQFNSSNTLMATGIYNYRNTSGSTVIYNFNGNYTLPFTLYENLTITGTGTKLFSGNTTINFALKFNGNAVQGICIMDVGPYNLTVNGITFVTAQGILKKTGPGNLLFVGLFSGSTGGSANFSDGNPNVELRGGLACPNFGINFGSGAVSFTTNSQTIDPQNAGAIFGGPVTVNSGITITVLQPITANVPIIFTGSLNGADATSTFINNGVVNYQNVTAPMTTGKLLCNQAANTFIYGLSGNQDVTVPSDPTPGYQNLTLKGSGAKRLLGNVSVKGTYTLTLPATLNSNGFSLTNP